MWSMWTALRPLAACLFILTAHCIYSHDITVRNCSREVSRKVFNFLATDFLRRVGLKDLSALPLSCPLAPSRSIYGDHELHKAQQRPQDWKCGYCQKRFVSEYYLDVHLHHHHREHVNEADDAVCLADYCAMANCHAYPDSLHALDEYVEDAEDTYEDEDGNVAHFHSRVSQAAGGGKAFRELKKCSERRVQQWRRQCEALIPLCFNEATSDGQRAGWLLRTELCENLQCRNGRTVAGFRSLTGSANGGSGTAAGGASAADGGSVWKTVLLAVRLVVALGVVVVVAAHVLFSDLSVVSLLGKIFAPAATSAASNDAGRGARFGDFLAAYQQQQRGQTRGVAHGGYGAGWFFGTIGEAFARAWRDAVRGTARKAL